MSDRVQEFMKRHPFLKELGVHPIWTAKKISEEDQKIKKQMNEVLGKEKKDKYLVWVGHSSETMPTGMHEDVILDPKSSDGTMYCYRCHIKMKERPHPTKPYVIEVYCPRCGFSYEVLTMNGKMPKK